MDPYFPNYAGPHSINWQIINGEKNQELQFMNLPQKSMAAISLFKENSNF